MNKKSYLILLLCFCFLLSSCSAKSPLQSGYLDEDVMAPPDSRGTTETYAHIDQNGFLPTDMVSNYAFSLKVDTASYTNVKRIIETHGKPAADAVRPDEMINYFQYDTPVPENEEHPLSIYTQTALSPCANGKYMSFIRIKTADINKSELPPSNFTFLIDTSGSMASYNKLPLLKKAFALLVDNLNEDDIVSLVTYSGTSAVLLDSVSGADKQTLQSAIDSLEATGSTAGGSGIQTAYDLAKKNYRENANNRVILATDGDFNVGISDVTELKNFISDKRASGVYLSILGFGDRNFRDDMMEALSANGNGNYSSIDSLDTAQKVLIDEMGTNLYVVAKDVKAQLQFNSENVKQFRLVGYENRKMSNDEFEDEKKDAGEIGLGSDIVILVELELNKDYQEGPLYNVCIRYTTPEQNEHKEINVSANNVTNNPDSDFYFACAVAGFGEILRGSHYNDADVTVDQIINLAQKNIGIDGNAYRRQFITMCREYAKNYN